MGFDRSAFLVGLREVAPALPAFVPFGIVFGIAAAEAGFRTLDAAVMSAMVFAGTVQFAVVELLGQDALPAIVVATGILVALRYALYSASLAPHFEDLPRRWKWSLAFLLLEVTYGMTISKLGEDTDVGGPWYYLGVGLPLWLLWIATTTVGAGVGIGLPASLDLGFAVPLIFIALLFSTIEDRWTAAAGAIAAVASVGTVAFPFGTGLIVAALVGVGGARLAERVIG